MKFLLFCILLSLAQPSLAAAASPRDSQLPISIRADAAELDGPKGVSVYRGEVQIEQGGMQIFADEVEVLMEEEAVARIIARGADQAVRYEQTFDGDNILAAATTLTYQVREEQLLLKGNASLTQADERVAGDRITYNIRSDTWQVFSEAKEPVSIVFRPGPR